MKKGQKGSRANVYKCIIKEANEPSTLEPKQNADNSSESSSLMLLSVFLKFSQSMTKSTLKSLLRENPQLRYLTT